MEQGFILLHRKIRDNQLWPTNKVFTKMEAWIDLLLMARYDHDPIRVLLGKEIVVCERGQVIRSVKTYQKRWNWGAQRVKSFFEILLKLKQISKKTTSKTTIITILNYDSYQGDQQTKNKPKINEKQTKNKPKTIKKQSINNVNNKIAHNFYKNQIDLNTVEPGIDNYLKFYNILKGINSDEGELSGLLGMEKQVSFKSFAKLLIKSKEKDKKFSDIMPTMNNDKKYFNKISLSRTLHTWLNNDF